jgi:hypothetical protein
MQRATDLKDKIYGCLNLVRSDKTYELRISVKYRKLVAEVYFNTTMKLIEIDKDVRVLTMCEPDFELPNPLSIKVMKINKYKVYYCHATNVLS